MGYALRFGLSPVFFGRRPNQGLSPNLDIDSTARQSRASHQAAKPVLNRTNYFGAGVESPQNYFSRKIGSDLLESDRTTKGIHGDGRVACTTNRIHTSQDELRRAGPRDDDRSDDWSTFW